MRSMATDLFVDRRRFLAAGVAFGVASATALRGRAARAAAGGGLFFSARADAAGSYFVTGFGADGEIVIDKPLATRGHGSAFAPDGRVVHFARRPGRFALVLDPAIDTIETRIDSVEGRHFEGHGAFSPDGRLLYATENEFEKARGVIGVYDATDNWRRVAEFDTGGMDPHEMRLMPDGNTLVVANGGILTHPDYPQENLDIGGMDPSLAYIDRREGRLVEKHHLPAELRQLSIHHLAVARDGTVFAVVQDAIRRADVLPLVIEHRLGAEPRWVDPGDAATARLDGYCGSAALDGSDNFLAVSSPRGGHVLFWDRANRRLAGELDLPDVCGLAPGGAPGVILATSGQGGALLHDVAQGISMEITAPLIHESHWDNHVFARPA
jgi:hypothetical protein